MDDNNPKRLSRLTAIVTQLQSHKLVTATTLAKKFGVTVRTIYRDIKALEESGIPVVTEEGKGYSMMEGYRIPPVMFTEREAIALVTAEQIILRDKDVSLKNEFANAVSKIKAVMQNHSKLKTEAVSKNTFVGKNADEVITSRSLIDVQMCIASRQYLEIVYSSENNRTENRTIEPYMMYYSEYNNWVMVAWCRMRKDFRSFRLDRIAKYTIPGQTFTPDLKAFNGYIRKKYLD